MMTEYYYYNYSDIEDDNENVNQWTVDLKSSIAICLALETAKGLKSIR